MGRYFFRAVYHPDILFCNICGNRQLFDLPGYPVKCGWSFKDKER